MSIIIENVRDVTASLEENLCLSNPSLFREVMSGSDDEIVELSVRDSMIFLICQLRMKQFKKLCKARSQLEWIDLKEQLTAKIHSSFYKNVADVQKDGDDIKTTIACVEVLSPSS